MGRLTLVGPQLRAARALLGLSAPALAEASQVSLKTIRRAEQSNGDISMTAANVERVRQVLVEKGIIFVDDDHGGPGVRLRRSPPPQFTVD